MQQQSHEVGIDRHLNLHELIHALVEDGRLDKQISDEFLIPARTGRLEIHPLVIISQQEWDDQARPGKKLTLEVLTQWLAERAGLPYMRIDPLKVDVTAVTAVTSSAYAGKHRILPVKVDKNKAVIATAEPDIRSWEDELAHVTGLQIERVIANPLDISRYLNEFYSVSHSIRRATSDKDSVNIPGVTNLEQLVELGKTGNLDANDKDVVQIVDWLLQYAFDQRASDIHMEPRREQGHIRFRIDGVMHHVYDMPTPVMTAVS
ncbi:MAG: type II/IV secretion system protein, partial [Pseudomonadota bacterium]|nr:type II/IV secretion system protein [Pseudomonadota bacterium]